MRKPWVPALTPEEAKFELDILGWGGELDKEEVDAYWIRYGSYGDKPISVEDSWGIAENYAASLADDHGLGEDDCLIAYLRKIVDGEIK
jgi:hypothetical protein